MTSILSTSPMQAGSLAAPTAPREDLRKAAEAFEAIFLRQLLASARASDFGGEDLFGGPGLEQFEAMRDEHFAEIASQQSTFGLADAIERQLSAFVQQGSE
ncbi:rod-binding protein [Aurantiacibacter poecillastricola]|uniref:rod-binding protein n=1 Tax=Aurantiacibacter poecillastricola TaxID=3064385 RepID=UPI00273DE64D|nr:rod-binding protein [Aurantiacibacter sp. 219JJ12-13]MDP5263117.1 rod-binding protein [Aurantiacibacter sp. 219JJ12-13]